MVLLSTRVLPSVVLVAIIGIGESFTVFGPSIHKTGATSQLYVKPSEGEKRRRFTEFANLEPIQDSKARKERLAKEEENKERFAEFGNELWELRSGVQELSEELVEAINNGDNEEEDMIRNSLRDAEARDPELTYKLELEAMVEAERDNREKDAKEHKENALNARNCLPQFNLEGLWVGKYGSHGYEMINITYSGDTLIAFKVTGDKNVPRGEISFQADLDPLTHPSNRRRDADDKEPLPPIILTEKASKKWGTQQLPRHRGLGRVAEEGFENAQWMEGQLIIIGKEYFSFAWVPIEHQIFFGRPSPELTLKMLRDGGVASLKARAWEHPPGLDDDVSILKEFATQCFEKTEEAIDEDLLGDEFGCIWHQSDTEECYFE